MQKLTHTIESDNKKVIESFSDVMEKFNKIETFINNHPEHLI